MMALLKKGIEVEVFTGSRDGEAKDLSPRIVPALESHGFVFESDARHVEYTTAPLTDYDALAHAIVAPRLQLRSFLEAEGGYTVLPGSTLALPFDTAFHPSLPNNKYYAWVGETFGTDILTSSIHISVGLDDPDEIVAVTNWLRLDMPLLLALAASSPYRNGQFTGYHSSRWVTFPQEPVNLRFFDGHADYVRFVEDGLASGLMRSVRHMWTAVRPNGDDRPYSLNRIETRICDLAYDPGLMLAITALLEARIQHLRMKQGKPAESMMAIARENERRVAKDSLNASVWHYGKEVPVRVAIARLIGEVEGLMRANGTYHHLAAIDEVLATGNEAMKLIKRVESLGNLKDAVVEAIDEAEAIDVRWARQLGLLSEATLSTAG
ncbi:MAG: glutamate--cysteine ligase [Candidatus Sericytochromatia bacterium]|nr:glutamate--cysteine ligase [Candidatus Sericytochromatia bacterium]